MKKEAVILSKNQPIPAEAVRKARKPYIKPLLLDLGDLRTLTLGNSITGMKDSGTGTMWEYEDNE